MMKVVKESLLHALWAAAVVAPVAVAPSWWAGGLSGLLLAAPRTSWPVEKWHSTLLDWAFFAIGGMAAGGILSGVGGGL